MATGRLCGLGLGPGDPELVTLKALRLLRAAPVVAYPAPERGDSFARSIVAAWLCGRQREIAIRFPMRPGPPPAAIYRDAAARLAAILDGGEDVAYLCQGDPLFYGSFAGILERLAGDYPVTIVPGVASPMACAAAAGRPLVQRDESLVVLPATLSEGELAARLSASDAAAIVKLGRHFAKLRRVLAALGLLDDAIYVERASLVYERVAPLAAIDPASVPYFATALVRREKRR
jgi:precorrin-2/cobalt-factor-2 C20-methyltransferase